MTAGDLAAWELRVTGEPTLERVQVRDNGAVQWERFTAVGSVAVEVGRWTGQVPVAAVEAIQHSLTPAAAHPGGRPAAGGAWWWSMGSGQWTLAAGEALAVGMAARDACRTPEVAVRFAARAQRIAGEDRVILDASALGRQTAVVFDAEPPGRPTAWADLDGEVLGLGAEEIPVAAEPVSGVLAAGQRLPVRLSGRLDPAGAILPMRLVLTGEPRPAD